MTSSSERIEVIEATWKIENFFQSSRLFIKRFFVGGRDPPADPQDTSKLPVELVASVSCAGKLSTTSKMNHISFRVYVHPDQPSSAATVRPTRANLLALKTSSGGDTFKDVNRRNYTPTEENDPFVIRRYFEIEDNDDGSLKIYFKLKFTFSIPTPSAANVVSGDFTELLNDFGSLLKNPRDADFKIRVSLGKGRTFRCHKLILKARSEVFRTMLESDMKEAKDGVVEVVDISPKAMQHFLSFLYCGRFADSSWIPELPQLAYAADKYCVKSLKNICDLHLIHSVKPRNALAVCKLAERHGLAKAAKDIREFIAENADELTVDTEVDTSNSDMSDANFVVSYSYGVR